MHDFLLLARCCSDMCNMCPTCTWRARQGFTTESEWQTAVNAELARLECRADTTGRVMVGFQ